MLLKFYFLLFALLVAVSSISAAKYPPVTLCDGQPKTAIKANSREYRNTLNQYPTTGGIVRGNLLEILEENPKTSVTREMLDTGDFRWDDGNYITKWLREEASILPSVRRLHEDKTRMAGDQ